MPPRRRAAPAPAVRPEDAAGESPRSAAFPGAARSPLIALGVLAGSGVLAVGIAVGRPALAAAVVVVQVALGLCWLLVLRGSPLTAALVGLAALACDLLLLRSRSVTAGSVAGVLGLSLLAAMVAQLARRNRRRVTTELAIATSGVVLVAAVSLALPLREMDSGESVALTALVAVAVALVITRLVPGPSLPVRLAALVVAVLVAGRFGAADEEMAAVWALAVGLASALAALVIDLGVVRITPGVGVRLRPPMTSVAALLPVVAAVPVAYAIGWIMGGS